MYRTLTWCSASVRYHRRASDSPSSTIIPPHGSGRDHAITTYRSPILDQQCTSGCLRHEDRAQVTSGVVPARDGCVNVDRGLGRASRATGEVQRGCPPAVCAGQDSWIVRRAQFSQMDGPWMSGHVITRLVDNRMCCKVGLSRRRISARPCPIPLTSPSRHHCRWRPVV